MSCLRTATVLNHLCICLFVYWIPAAAKNINDDRDHC